MNSLHATNSAENPAVAGEEQLVARIVGFVRMVRANGFPVGVREEIDALKVAEHCTVLDQRRLRWGLRSLLCSNAEEWQRFDQLFDAYWLSVNRQTRIEHSPRAKPDLRETPARHLSGHLSAAKLDLPLPETTRRREARRVEGA